ncbi:MAG: hypothetical protein Ta2B_13740 [Termitinemataceae bacterium]|nr:MAG: hypothetical protein Ta2B_13740 [Termitinemataceae bacterium]
MFDAGYSVYPNLYKFEDYGVPQARHRIIIVGIRKDQNVVFKIPSTKPYKSFLRTAKDAIEKPPIPKDAPNNELKMGEVSPSLQNLRFFRYPLCGGSTPATPPPSYVYTRKVA